MAVRPVVVVLRTLAKLFFEGILGPFSFIKEAIIKTGNKKLTDVISKGRKNQT